MATQTALGLKGNNNNDIMRFLRKLLETRDLRMEKNEITIFVP